MISSRETKCIPQCNSFVLLGVTLQSDRKFNEHVRTKLVKANKCLHVLRTLRKEHYSQAEIDHLFISIVLPNFSYALSVYGASESDLTVIQNFLDRCHKRSLKFIRLFRVVFSSQQGVITTPSNRMKFGPP